MKNPKDWNSKIFFSDDLKDFGNELKEKIESFRDLPKGWDMGSGERISDRIIKEAIKISYMCRFPFVEKYATPNSDGGITLTFAIGEKFIDVIVNPDGSFDMQEERGFGLDYDIVSFKQGVSLDKIHITIHSLCTSFVVYPSISTIPSKKDSTVMPSKITREEYPFLKKRVPLKEVKIYAHT